MLFNSFSFLVFFPIVCVLYFACPHKWRWILLLVASYYFYMNWKPIYALLIFASTFVTWIFALLISKNEDINSRKLYLIISLIINFGILFLYKYFDFLNIEIKLLLKSLSLNWPLPNLDLLLPVGISFYTFQAVGYTIDVYKSKIKHENHFGHYALFVSFFPQLVAGPIERTSHLLPQFKQNHKFSWVNFEIGIKQMIWGFFMKLVIADRLALYVQPVYTNLNMHNGTTIAIATIFFSFQIYCDFAGYSNIAIGASRIMGYDLMENFKRPYFAENIADFWHRWHISLSTWFRDYLYIPLGGNRNGLIRTNLNLFITFIISGIWHGANWTFLIWGGWHGFLQIFQKQFNNLDLKTIIINSKVLKLTRILFTFTFVSFTWIFFRASSVGDSYLAVTKILTSFGMPFIDATTFFFGLIGLIFLFTYEFMNEFYPTKMKFYINSNPIISGLGYSLLLLLVLLIGVFDESQFIYFQF